MTYNLKNAPDPIGPGTAAWQTFDLYVEALRDDPKSKLSAMRRAALRKELHKAGHGNVQDAWCARAKEMAQDLEG